MVRFAMVVLPGAFHASIGAMLDSYALVYDRLGHVVLEQDKIAPQLELSILSIDGKPVKVGGDVLYPVDRAIASADVFDCIWLPSFRIGDVDRIRQRLASIRQLTGWLQDRVAGGAIIAASGSAALLLVKSGLLDRKRVPVSRILLPTVRELFPRCRADDNMMLADYGNLIIGSGISHDFLVIERAISRAVSAYSGRWLAEVTALDHAERKQLATDPLVESAQLWIEQLYASDLSISGLASRLSTSHQTLTRRFRNALGVTPKAYAQQMRITAAQQMLASSTRSVDHIARLVGYSDVRIFRDAFRRSTGVTPNEWRLSPVGRDENHTEIDD